MVQACSGTEMGRKRAGRREPAGYGGKMVRGRGWVCQEVGNSTKREIKDAQRTLELSSVSQAVRT